MTKALAKVETVEAEPTTAIVLRPLSDDEKLALKDKAAEATRALAALRAMPCTTPEHEQAFADFLTMCTSVIAALEEQRTARTGPLHAEKTRIDKLYKPTKDAWSACEAVIREKLQAAAQARLDAQRAALKLAESHARAGDVGAAVTALVRAPERAVVSGIRPAEEWEVAEHDIAKIPRDWLTVDWSKVKIYLREHQNAPEIPAVEGFTFRRKAKVVRHG